MPACETITSCPKTTPRETRSPTARTHDSRCKVDLASNPVGAGRIFLGASDLPRGLVCGAKSSLLKIYYSTESSWFLSGREWNSLSKLRSDLSPRGTPSKVGQGLAQQYILVMMSIPTHICWALLSPPPGKISSLKVSLALNAEFPFFLCDNPVLQHGCRS